MMLVVFIQLMSGDESGYSKIERGYAFTKGLNDEIFNAFESESFTTKVVLFLD